MDIRTNIDMIRSTKIEKFFFGTVQPANFIGISFFASDNKKCDSSLFSLPSMVGIGSP
jgi:hypothetical protein